MKRGSVKSSAELAAADRRVRRRRVRTAEIAARAPEQNQELMIATIIEVVRDRGSISTDDLLRAGLPRSFIDSHFRRCLALAKDAAPDIEHLVSPA